MRDLARSVRDVSGRMRTLACLLDGHAGEIPHTDVPKPLLRAGARFVHGAAHSGYRA